MFRAIAGTGPAPAHQGAPPQAMSALRRVASAVWEEALLNWRPSAHAVAGNGAAHAASDDNLSQVPAGRHGSRGSRWRGGTDAVGGKGRALPRLTRGSCGDAPPSHALAQQLARSL